jgi:DNA-binding transcriptional regulator YhcF (GntR family)
MPPQIAARFTQAERAVLAVVAAETVRQGDCRLSIGHLAALAGVCASTVKNAMREARRLGLISIEERRVSAFQMALPAIGFALR